MELTDKSGYKKPTNLLRELLLHGGKVTAALTSEESRLIADLGKMGTNIWEIRKDLMRHGTDSRMIADLGVMYNDFRLIKEHFISILLKNDS